MTDKPTKKAFIVRDFNDAGAERNYTASVQGKPDTFVDIDVGAFENYALGGLVREPTPEDKKAPAAA